MNRLIILGFALFFGSQALSATMNWRCRAAEPDLTRYLDLVIYNQTLASSRTQGMAVAQGELFGYMVPRNVKIVRTAYGTHTALEYQFSKTTKLSLKDFGGAQETGTMTTSVRKDKVVCSRAR